MKTITQETQCKLCKIFIPDGQMAQINKEYICEKCCLELPYSELVLIKLDSIKGEY